MDKELSERIALLRFPLIVCVVYIHMGGTTVSISGSEVGLRQVGFCAAFVMGYVDICLACVVPLFYFLSGFLFFYGFNFSKYEYLYKVKSRLRSLVVPYLFWNILILIFFEMGQAISYTSKYFAAGSWLSSLNLFDYLNLILGLNRQPIAIQFWFIRDLMLLVCLVPFIDCAIKKSPAIYLGGVLFMSFFNIWPLYTPSVVSLCFFSFGAFAGAKKYNIGLLDMYGKVNFAAFVVLSVADALSRGTRYNFIIHGIGLIFGMINALFLSNYLFNNKRLKSIIDMLTPTTFFIFATHVVVLAVVKKLAYKLYGPDTDLSVISFFFLLPIVAIIVCVQTYHAASKLAPRLTNIATGGR